MFFKKWKKQTHHTLDIENMNVSINLSRQSFLSKVQMIGLTVQDLKVLKALEPTIQSNIDLFVEAFYNTILAVPHLRDMMNTHSTLERLKGTLSTHIAEIFSGHLNDAYIQKRERISAAHVRIGLEAEWYIGAVQNLRASMIKVVFNEIQDKDFLLTAVLSINKILTLEEQITIELYEQQNQKIKDAQQAEEHEMKQRMSRIAEELVALSQETNASVELLINNSQEVNRSVYSSNEQANETQTIAFEGQKRLIMLTNQIETIFNNMKNVQDMVSSLKQSLNEMSEFVQIVQDIADQINLLSLNSAIEAARAGEHGKGFAVVAGEVRKLADQTKASITQIQSLIERSDSYMKSVVRSVENVSENVDTGKDVASKTDESFKDILAEMDKSLNGFLQIGTQMNELVETIREIGTATQKVTESAELLTRKNE